MPKRLPHMTTPTRLVLRTLVNAQDGEQLWTGEIAGRADLQWETASNVLKRLLGAEWVTSSKESRESAAERVAAPRRYWELTEEGREAAVEVLATGASRTRDRVAARENTQQADRGDLSMDL